MRYRFWGDRVYTMDASSRAPVVDARAFRHSDLSPREELAEARAELARLEGYERMTTLETKQEFPDLPSARRIEELRKKVRDLDLWINDSAPTPPGTIVTAADLNRYHEEFYRLAPPPAKVVTVADVNRRNAEHYGHAGGE